MNGQSFAKALEQLEAYFRRSTSTLEEKDSGFAPAEGMYTVAQQVAEVAHTLTWFMKGAFGGGFDMDFEAHQKQTRSVTSLDAARQELDAAFAEARSMAAGLSDDALNSVFPADDPIMPGAPRASVLTGIADHTAHHRGALTVYARLLGKTPPMPYM